MQTTKSHNPNRPLLLKHDRPLSPLPICKEMMAKNCIDSKLLIVSNTLRAAVEGSVLRLTEMQTSDRVM